MFFDQRSPQHPEVGVLQWHGQTDRHTDGHVDSMTDPAQRAESVKTRQCKGKGYMVKGDVDDVDWEKVKEAEDD